MEVLGIAASIIAVIQLAEAVSGLCYRYIGTVKRAQKDSQELMGELSSLNKVLGALKEYTDKNPHSTTVLQMLNAQGGPLSGCLSELKRLETKFNSSMPRGWRRKIMRSLKWPLEETETLQIISRIERQKSLFTIALSTDHIILSKAIERYVQNMRFSVEEFQKEFRAESAAQESWRQGDDIIRRGKKRKNVLDWLYLGNFDTKHIDVSRNRQGGTGKWFFESPEVREWAEGHGNRKWPLLWGHGIPGAGKTYISSLVIDHFQDQAKVMGYGVAYIYFDYNEQDQQTSIHVLASLVKQLTYQILQLPAEIEELHDTSQHDGKRPTLEELYVALLVTFKSFSRVFLIFDALDEYNPEQRKELLPLMHRMGKDGASLFLTSRDYPEDIRFSFRDVPQIKISAAADDIKCYIQEKIQKNPRAKRLIQQGDCEDRIISELTECAEGMFLLVRFHIDYLCQQPTAKQIITALEKMKKSSAITSLDLTYDRVMKTIRQKSESCVALALKIFTWMLKARRTLRVDEIQIAVSVEKERYELDELDLPDRMTILDVCGGFIMIDEAGDIRFAHLTIQEYLLRKPIVPQDAELQITIACATYLSFNVFAGSSLTPAQIHRARYSRLQEHPFFEYAHSNLSSHLRSCDENLSMNTILKFLKSPGSILCFHSHYFGGYGMVGNRSPLHIAAILGHCQAVQQLLDEGASVSALVDFDRTPLHLASTEGHEAVVRLLIERGASLSAKDGNGITALHYSAKGGHEAVMRLLLRKGADISAMDSNRETALWKAAVCGHEVIVRILLEKSANISTVNSSGNSALHGALWGGYSSVAQLLIEEGIDISIVNHDGMTALLTAVCRGNLAVVRLLLHRGANVSAVYSGGWTALLYAAERGNEEMIQLILENGADVLAATKDGWTALMLAALNGHEVVVRLLLEKGADVLAVNGTGNTALFVATSHKHKATVRLLLEKGTDTPDMLQDRKKAFFKAAFDGCEAVVRLFLEKGVDVLAADEGGETVLCRAVSGGHKAMIQFLIEKGADISTVDEMGWTALHYSAEAGTEEAARFLIANGIEISDGDKNRETPLFIAARSGNWAVARLLVESGADISVTNKTGDTALLCAAYTRDEAMAELLLLDDTLASNRRDKRALWWGEAFKGCDSVVHFLIKNGADVSVANNDGVTVLELVVRSTQMVGEKTTGWIRHFQRKNEAVIKTLLENGADPLAPCGEGRTAMQIAVSCGNETVIHMLQEALRKRGRTMEGRVV